MTVCLLLTAGRLILRWKKLRTLHADDIWNAIAAFLVIPFVVVGLIALPIEYRSQLYYLRRVGEPPSLDEMILSYRVNFASLVFFWLILYSVKASFLSLYWKIFAVSTWFRYVWWISTAFITTSFLITIISIFWQCGSPSQISNFEVCEENETTPFTLLIIWCTLNVLGGVLLMALPLVMVTTRLMKLEKSARIGLIVIFSLVVVDIAFDIVRTVYSLSGTLSTQTNLNSVWTFLEPTIAVTVCALPCYKGFISGKRSKTVSESSLRKPNFQRGSLSVVPIELELESPYSLPSFEERRAPV
ncbi:uncharacterized protein EI97DRAFT_298194 [Westerdykella ornata]|uniref:Rhodopsin domain-containing protein n=1 Tax=Westerdykella ornata TaxID=318751 RepID=A0A6A6JM55_WESOR|nr:uncharacterized protein EI97DRAFT_298194 [Westerdykella ornata]KAF2277582.1 hypothetical protein EI97DRAFT_298194 [Westerdykella ornata]